MPNQSELSSVQQRESERVCVCGGGGGGGGVKGEKRERERRYDREGERRKEKGEDEKRESTYFPVSVSQTATVLSKEPVSTVSPMVLKPRHITSAE